MTVPYTIWLIVSCLLYQIAEATKNVCDSVVCVRDRGKWRLFICQVSYIGDAFNMAMAS